MEIEIEQLKLEVRQLKLSFMSLLVEEVRAGVDCYKKQKGKTLKNRNTAKQLKQCSTVQSLKSKRRRRKLVVPPKRVRKERKRAYYKCDICQQEFNDRRFFNKHVVGHEKDSNKGLAGFRCPICEKDFETVASLAVHQSWHEKAESFTCLVCKAVFKEMDELTIHYNKDHMSVPTSLLKMLERNMLKRKILKRRHIFKDHKCRYCPRSFSQIKQFTEHTLDHLVVINKIPPLTFNCPLCEEKFTKMWGVLTHSQYHPQEKTPCPKCIEILKDPYLLIIHYFRNHFEAPEKIVQLIVKSFTDAVENPKNIQRRVANRKPLKCQNCFLSFINEERYKSHMENVCKIARKREASINATENEGPHKCSICEAEFETVLSFKRHMTITHRDIKTDRIPGVKIRVHNCTACSESFNFLIKFRQHILDVHHDNKELKDTFCFNCQLCEESFFSEALLTFHQRTIHDAYRQCPLCIENFSTNEEFLKHINESHSENGDDDFIKCNGGYLCRKCGVKVGVSAGKLQLKRHLQFKHSEETVKCDVCGQGFANEAILAAHMIAGHAENSFVCEECGKQLKNSKSLRSHKKTHGNENRVSCKDCDKTFATTSSYRSHYYSFHANKKLYKCNVCQKEFGNAVGLHTHKITTCEKDKAKISKCSMCEKTFENYLVMYYHKVNIHKYGNTEEDVCHVCNKKVTNPQSLMWHNKLYHTGENKQIVKNPACTCNICGTTRANKIFLFDHWLTHKPEKSFECTACDTGFKLRSGFLQHRRHRHKENKHLKIKVHTDIYEKLKKEFNSVFKLVAEVEPEQHIMERKVNKMHSENIGNGISPAGDGGVNFSGGDMDDILQNLENKSEDVRQHSNDTNFNSQKPQNKDSVEPVPYIDFSRANVPVILEKRVESMESPDSPGEAIKDATQSTDTTETINDDETETETENRSVLIEQSKNDNCSNKLFESTDYFSDVEASPMECFEDSDTLNEDKKPIISENMIFHLDPFPRKLILRLEKLQTHNCNICNVVYHSLKLYKGHTKSRSHRATEREFRLKMRVLKKAETLKKRKEKLKRSQEKKNESKMKIKRSRANGKNKVRKLKVRKAVEKEALLKCPYCEDKFVRLSKYRAHLATHKVHRYPCLLCTEKFVVSRTLVIHYMKEHDGQKVLKCDICQKAFLKNDQLTFHMNYAHKKAGDHNENESKRKRSKSVRYYKCDICGDRSDSGAAYKNHLLSHNEDEQKCVYCSAGFKSQDELENHYNEAHSGEMPIKCDECSQKFSTKFRLELHKKENHVPEITEDDSEKKHICNVCGTAFRNRSNYNYHKSTHVPNEDRRKVFCEFCGKSFFGGHSLTIHRRLHTGEKPFLCDQCDMTFISPDHLRHHHDGVHKQILKCEICGKSSSTMKNLKSHKRRMHGKGNATNSGFSCSECPRTFSTPEKLEKHSQLHDPTRPFGCDQCNFRFNHSSNLNLHKKMLHKM